MGEFKIIKHLHLIRSECREINTTASIDKDKRFRQKGRQFRQTIACRFLSITTTIAKIVDLSKFLDRYVIHSNF